jgi:hypothetical protein
MAGFGIPHEDICRLVISPRTKEPIDAKTLRSAFRAELDEGHVKANSAVAGSLYKQALAGNVTAAIWWSKARMGWKETVTQEMTGKDGTPLGLTATLIIGGHPAAGNAEHKSAPKAVGDDGKQGDRNPLRRGGRGR